MLKSGAQDKSADPQSMSVSQWLNMHESSSVHVFVPQVFDVHEFVVHVSLSVHVSVLHSFVEHELSSSQ